MKSKKYVLIMEQTSIVKARNLNILEESKTHEGKNKVVFEAKLQESNVKNANKRMYSQSICESIVNQLSPKATNRSLLCEIDHPMFVSSDPDMLKRRAAIVEINNCAAIIRDIKVRGNEVIGEIETLSGFKGPDLANLILKDKVNIGFSLRAMGSVEPMHDGTLMVKSPIMPITYDIVSNPSHSSARVLEFLPESYSDFTDTRDCDSLYESFDPTLLENDQIRICNESTCVIRFLDDIINEQFAQVVNKIKFKL